MELTDLIGKKIKEISCDKGAEVEIVFDDNTHLEIGTCGASGYIELLYFQINDVEIR